MLTDRLTVRTIVHIECYLAFHHVGHVAFLPLDFWTVRTDRLPKDIATATNERDALCYFVAAGCFGDDSKCSERSAAHCTLDNKSRYACLQRELLLQF